MIRIHTYISILVLGSIVLLAAGCSKNSNTTDSSHTPSAQIISNPKDISFTIEPSRVQDNWIIYSTGAIAKVKGQNLTRVEIKYLPTGTGAAEEYPGGISLGTATNTTNEPNTWMTPLPPTLAATNFWFEATNTDGQIIKGQDLGNVAFGQAPK